jgi:hypothetical protein
VAEKSFGESGTQEKGPAALLPSGLFAKNAAKMPTLRKFGIRQCK